MVVPVAVNRIVALMELEEGYMGIAGDFQQIVCDVVSWLVWGDDVGCDTSKVVRR